jgi:hypothetical protein
MGTMSARYAAGTEVSSSRSRDEIERTLTRYGAVQFIYGWDANRAVIGFAINDRQVRFLLPMPDRDAREFTHTPARGNRRSDAEIQRAYEQAVKQRWRALALVIKAKLEAGAAGIVTFEDEFAMHMILPDGRTVRDHVLPAIEDAYATGTVRPFLAIGGSS